MILLRRLVPVVLLAAAFAAIWRSGLPEQLTWSGLGRNQALLADWVAAHPLLSRIGYVGLYALSTALSLPQAVLLTIAGGLLFGALAGTALASAGATAGATILFVVARSALGQSLSRRGGQTVANLRAALHRDGFSYLLAIRLLPVFPFWVVNLAASVSGMRLRSYVLATAIGVIPGTFVFASLGSGVGGVLASGGTPDLSVVFTLPVLGPLVGLALLSLFPVAWKKWKASNA